MLGWACVGSEVCGVRATRLAAALAEVGHHRVDGVADEHGRVVGPRPKELGPPVVEVALLDGGGGRRVEHIPVEKWQAVWTAARASLLA